MKNINLVVPFATQVVLLDGVKILNESRFQPKGFAGVISDLFSDAFHAFKIKFPDESEAMEKRKDFSVKKHFQQRLLLIERGEHD